MGQSFNILENIAPLVKASSTTITMAPTYLGMPTRITVGGQMYKASSTITLNTAVTGFNGLDTGSLSSNQLYYIYAVQSSGSLGIVASTAAPGTGPAGFSAWKEIGRFRTDFGGANINTVINKLIGAKQSSNAGTTQIYSTTPSQALFSSTTLTWKQDTDVMIIQGSLPANGTGSATAITFTLPVGVTLNTTLQATGQFLAGQFASGTFSDAGIVNTIAPYFVTSSTFALQKTDSTVLGTTAIRGSDLANGDIINFTLRFPIAEWHGLYD